VRFETMTVWAATLSLLVAAGCGDDSKSGTGSGGNGATGGTGGTGGVPDPTPISEKATVKLKARDALVGDLAQALYLDDNELCNELGTFDCGDVHSIALGGVDAYGAGVYEPLKASAVTTPIAVDRLVLSACQVRAHRDFVSESASPALFVGLDVTDGRIDPTSDAVAAIATTLFRRGLLREPKEAEIEHLRQLYVDIEGTGGQTPAQDWAALSCYAVFTMMEAVFY
jgi:hypothetical protein